MIKITSDNAGTEVVATHQEWQMWLIGCPGARLFIFLLLCALSILSNFPAKFDFGWLVMGLVALIGAGLVFLLVFSCFSKAVLRINQDGVEYFHRWFISALKQRIPLGRVGGFKVEILADDEAELPSAPVLVITSKDGATTLHYGRGAEEKELQEIEKKFAACLRRLRKR